MAFGALDKPGAILGAIDAYAPGRRNRSYTREALIPGPLLSCTSALLPARHGLCRMELAMSRGCRPCSPGRLTQTRGSSPPLFSSVRNTTSGNCDSWQGKQCLVKGPKERAHPKIMAHRSCWPRQASGKSVTALETWGCSHLP